MTDAQKYAILEQLPDHYFGNSDDISLFSKDLCASNSGLELDEVIAFVKAYCNANGITLCDLENTIFCGPSLPPNVPNGSIWFDSTRPGVAFVFSRGKWLQLEGTSYIPQVMRDCSAAHYSQ